MSRTIGVKIIFGIFLALSICGIITVSLVYKLTGGKIPFEYGIILDAGSSKTQVTVYKWEGQKDNGTGIVSQVKTIKSPGGIHQAKNPSHAGESILPFLKEVSSSVPEEQHDKTPLFLGATAGMRMLREQNSSLAESILQGIEHTLSHNSKFSVRDVGIISGSAEGMFAWVTGNFLLETLHSEEHDPSSTYGSLDMGGASTQIAFEIPPKPYESIDNDTTTNMELYGRDHLVFAQSYLCFGVNEAMRRHYAVLAKTEDAHSLYPTGFCGAKRLCKELEDLLGRTKDDIIEDPCGFKDDTVKRTGEYLYNHFCTKHLDEKINMDTNYTFKGTGNNKECTNAVAKLLDHAECKNMFDSPCFTPPKEIIANVKYMAVSTFYFTASALNVTHSSLTEHKDAFNKYCELSVDNANSTLVPGLTNFVRDYCIEGHYVHHILTKEYGFNETTWENIMFVDKINKSDLGWSLGYMINATNAIPKEKPSMPLISKPTFIVLIVIFSVLLIASILTILFLPQYRKSSITVLP